MEKNGVYLIKSRKGNLYIGSTTDINRRLNEHNKGKCKYTKKDKEGRLIYFEEYRDIDKVRTIEREIKKSRYERDRFYRRAEIWKRGVAQLASAHGLGP